MIYLSFAEHRVRQGGAVVVRGGDPDEAVPAQDPRSHRSQRGGPPDDQAPFAQRRSGPVRGPASTHFEAQKTGLVFQSCLSTFNVQNK